MDFGLNNLTDEDLAGLALKNPEIYSLLINRYKDQLLNFIFSHFVRDRQLAEDICQDSFLKAYLNLAKFDNTKKWKTWLYKIAINSAYSLLRKPKTENLDDYADTLSSGLSLEKELDDQLQKEKLDQAMQKLDPQFKIILDLFYKKDLSYEEISNVLNLQLGTVKTRIHRAKQQLILNFDELN